MGPFGVWLKEQRLAKQLHVIELAELTNVNATTISRIENDKSEPFIDTVIHLCAGLGVTLEKFWEDLEILDSGLPPISENKGKINYLTKADISTFMRLYRLDIEAASSVFGELLCLAMGQPFDPFYKKILLHLQDDSPIIGFEIGYPKEISLETLVTIYTSGAFVTSLDAGTYLRKRRSDRKMIISTFSSKVNLSSPILSRMENNFVERVKLADVVAFTRVLESPEIFALYWSAFTQIDEFLSGTTAGISKGIILNKNIKLVFTLTNLYRWWQLDRDYNPNWLNNLRDLAPS